VVELHVTRDPDADLTRILTVLDAHSLYTLLPTTDQGHPTGWRCLCGYEFHNPSRLDRDEARRLHRALTILNLLYADNGES
jgi:hypothetical protein